MRIVIPTRGRWDLTLTCDRLPKEWRTRVDVVCPSRELRRHKEEMSRGQWANVVVQPDDGMTIAAKRAWIMATWRDEKIVMMDDDLVFFRKRTDDPTRLVSAEPADISLYLEQMERWLSPMVPHAGFGSRLMNNRRPPGWSGPSRMQYVLGYHLPTVREECELGRIETREDMDYVLQLLRRGLPNKVCDSLVVEQSRGYGAKGGASGERTAQGSNDDAELLARLHPGYVRVVKKEYQKHPRREVVCQWGKALRDGEIWRANRARGDEDLLAAGSGAGGGRALPASGRAGGAKSARRGR